MLIAFCCGVAPVFSTLAGVGVFKCCTSVWTFTERNCLAGGDETIRQVWDQSRRQTVIIAIVTAT